ncbi:MAG: hypothetical protein DELT_01246 [Desulfovibrio sp.]
MSSKQSLLYGNSSLMERLMDQDEEFPSPLLQWFGVTDFPLLQVTEDTDALYVRACIPGVALDGVSLILERNVLRIEGSISHPEGECLRCERPCGFFKREVKLPCAVDANAVQAVMRDGLLSVTLPKQAQPQKKRAIPVAKAQGGGE